MRIAAGLGYSEDILVNGVEMWRPWCHYPVGYSALLALAYKVADHALWVAPVVNALVGTALVVIVHRIARYFVSETRARVAATITALHPGLILYTAVLMTEPLAATLVLGAALSLVRRRLPLRSSLLAGLLFGLATLVRPSSLLAAPLVALLFPLPSWRALGRAVLVTTAAVVVCVPWTYRNCRVMDGCAFVSTNGGWNLAIGALTDTGRFVTLKATDGCPVVTGQVQQDRCWAEVGVATIAKDPVAWLARAPKKLAQTFNHESFAIEYLREANPGEWQEERRIAGRSLLSIMHQLLLLAAALGLVSKPSRKGPLAIRIPAIAVLAGLVAFALFAALSDDHPFWIVAVALPLLGLSPGAPRLGPVGRFLLALVFITTVTHVVFFGDDRYHLVVTPALCLLAASALRPASESHSARSSAPTLPDPNR
jgi:4-amino-4-deoxy-L-arabinose transferase-like glycosyltransferase